MRACPLQLHFDYSSQCYRSRILASATSQVYAFRLRNSNKAHEIKQLANLKRTLRILANEWLVQWFQGFESVYCLARQIVPRRNLIVPHEMSVKIRRERRLLIANLVFCI